MKTKQFIGPFSYNQILNFDDLGNVKIVQIGIERPHSIPISEEGTQKIIIQITGAGRNYDGEYCLGETDLLEFENLYTTNLRILVKDANNPYLIITAAYE